jgi:iron-sulfur cluster assembly protein
MLSLTPAAITKVKSILTERGEEGGLRVLVGGDGCSGLQYQMTLEKEVSADDQVIEMEGLKVFIDSRSGLYLANAQIDYVEGPDGSGFRFDNPDAHNNCSCGESFYA